MKQTITFILVLGIYVSAFTQNKFSIEGTVFDENNELLIGASVFLYPVNKATTSDVQGRFSIKNLSKGKYQISVSYIGYQTFKDTILIDKNIKYKAKLSAKLIGLQEIVVNDNYAERRKKNTALSVEVVNKDYLKMNLGGSLMKSLERLPGISSIDIGSGQSKPIIRGLGFNRIAIVENNIKHEGQQWGADHGLEIDQYAVDDLEIIKGPASLVYGSDAIGGVLNIKNNKVPENNSVDGSVDFTSKSNNNLLGLSALLSGRKKWFFGSFRTTYLDYGDYKVPTDSIDIYSYRAALNNNFLRNTAGKEVDLHLSFGIIKPRFKSQFFVSHIFTKSGFFANAHGLEPRNVDELFHDKSNRDIQFPRQNVKHLKITNQSAWNKDNWRVELDLGFQRNFRQEWSKYVSHGYMPATFPKFLNFDADLEREFEKYIYSGNVRVIYSFSEKTHLNIGISADYQQNKIGGRGFIIPNFKQINIGNYAFLKHNFSKKSLIQFGIRYDYANIKTENYKDWFASPTLIAKNDTLLKKLDRSKQLNRNFSNISWSVGYNYNLDNYSFKVNVGKSFRTPIPKELAANGVNYHYFRYEVGKADLSPEISYQIDLGIEYNSKKFAFGMSPFFNYFSNYIYLNPTAQHDRLYGNGNQIFNYTQSKVLHYGAEIHLHYQLLKPLKFGLIGEYVYSEQISGNKKGFSLPFSPPATAIFNLRYEKINLKFVERAYVSFDYKLTAKQKNIVPPELETAGYQIFNLGIGANMNLKKQRIELSFQIQNLFNKKYFNHTGYYRLINVPEPGRNFILNISFPFKLNKL